jgi:opacity protein-like surface antigen
MKKIVLITTALTLLCAAAFANDDDAFDDPFAKNASIEWKLNARLAYNHARASYERTGDGSNYGSPGVEAGVHALFGLTDDINFNPGLNLIYKRPIASIHDFALSAPFLIQYNLFTESFFVKAGLQLDIILYSLDTYYLENGRFEERSSFDYGVVLGGSIQATDDIAIDLGFFYAFNKFSLQRPGSHLFQICLGASYLIK